MERANRNKLYWIISILTFLITFKLAISSSLNPYKIIMLISPIPLLLGFMEVFKGKENNMLELELSFKISGKEIILSTHIVADIEYIAKQVILIKEGQLIESSTGDRLLKEMQGKVWKVEVDEKDIVGYEDTYQVVNIMRKADKVQLRILSPHKPVENAIGIESNFEDMYMHYFNENIE